MLCSCFQYVDLSSLSGQWTPPTVSSLTHKGLVLPLVGIKSLEHLVLPLIEAEKKVGNAENCCTRLMHSNVDFISRYYENMTGLNLKKTSVIL